MRDTRPDPWEEVVKNIQPGQLVRGKVVTIIPQGCCGNADGVEGFIHISQLSIRRVDDPRDAVSEGDEIVAKVIGIDEERRRISLSVKAIHVDKEGKNCKIFCLNRVKTSSLFLMCWAIYWAGRFLSEKPIGKPDVGKRWGFC